MSNLSLRQFEAQSFAALSKVAFSRLEEFRSLALKRDTLLSEQVKQAHRLESTVHHLKYFAKEDSDNVHSPEDLLSTQLNIIEEGREIIRKALPTHEHDGHSRAPVEEMKIRQLTAVLESITATREELLKEKDSVRHSS